MDAVTNPYSPGAGLRPAVLAGRDGERAAFDAVLQRATLDRPVRGLMLTGLRGVGKTVLLNELADSAEEAGWITVGMEVRSDGARPFLATVAQQLSAGLRRGLGRKIGTATTRALASVKAFSLTVDPTGQIGVNIDLDAAGSGDLEVDFAALAVDVGRRARELGIGVAVMVDELQELDKRTLAAVAAAAHAAGQRGVPFVIVGAGLPSLPGRLAEAKSYSERLFDYRPLGRLDADTAARAVTEPAADSGASWEPDAVTTVVDAADGYPYFLQEYGSACWQVAAGPGITAHDAENGITLGRAILDGGFFRSRWDRATPTERLYLAAMAADGVGPARTPDVATRLDRTQSNLGPIRASLIGKGLVYAPEYGQIAFTVPGMADFVHRQT